MGAIGYLPNSFKRLYAVCLVEVDEYGGVKRNESTGLGTLVKDGQPGLLLGKLKKGRDFVGYTDSKATNKKTIHDVLEKGDSWFSSGDLLYETNGVYWLVQYNRYIILDIYTQFLFVML